MPRYPSKECDSCSVSMEQQDLLEKSKNDDGTFKFPVFELASCSCFRLNPEGCFAPRDEKHSKKGNVR